MITKEDLQSRFTYHPPTDCQPELYADIRDKAKRLVEFMVDITPESREQSLAITKIEEAVFWANAAIAREE